MGKRRELTTNDAAREAAPYPAQQRRHLHRLSSWFPWDGIQVQHRRACLRACPPAADDLRAAIAHIRFVAVVERALPDLPPALTTLLYKIACARLKLRQFPPFVARAPVGLPKYEASRSCRAQRPL